MNPNNTTQRFSLSTLSVWAISLAVPVATFFFLPTVALPLIGTKVSLLILALVVAFIAFVIIRFKQGVVALPPLLLLASLWLIPVAYILSTLFSGVNIMQAVFGVELETDTVAFVLFLSVLATVTALTLTQAKEYKRFLSIMTVAFCILVVGQMALLLLSLAGTGFARTGNFVGTYMDLGMVLGLGVVLSLLSLRALHLRKWTKIALTTAIGVSTFFLIFVNSAIVWALIALVSGALFVETVMKRGSKKGTDDAVASFVPPTPSVSEARPLGTSLIVLVISIFFMFAGAGVTQSLSQAFGINVFDVKPSWQSTFMIGSHTFASSPFFGSGPGTFAQQWLTYRDTSLNNTVFWNIDFLTGVGYIPTSIVTTGLLGALAWIIFLGMFLFTGVRALLFRAPEEPFIGYVALISFVGAFYVFLLALFTDVSPIVFALGAILLGIFISSLRYGRGRRELLIEFSKSPRLGFVVVFVLTLLLLCSVASTYTVVQKYVSNFAYSEAVSKVTGNDLDGGEALTLQSISVSPSERAYQLEATIGLARMQKIATETKLETQAAQDQFQTVLTNSIASAQEATRIGRYNYQNWVLLGNIYRGVAELKIEGAYEAAQVAYLEAQKLNPTSPVIPFLLAQLEVVKANYTGAEEQLLAAINLKRDYIPGILLLSQLKIQQGKASEALQAAEAAAYFAPNDPSILFQVGLLRSGTRDIKGAIAALARAVELNPQYANARFFLAAVYSSSGQFADAVAQLQFVSDMSEENATAVANDLAALKENKNPFPEARLRSLGIPEAPVTEPTASTGGGAQAPVAAPVETTQPVTTTP